ncbi:MAG: hypothetical protein P8L20_02375 [Flavobacteriales bacterium]|nr:hypothetical protein [Flavobacteriales bacterium]
MNRLIYIVFTSITLIFGCKKSNSESVKYYYNYFPLEIGAWIEYDVVDIIHSELGSDTAEYQLKEIAAEEFLDNEGRLTYRIERYWRDDSNANWSVKDVWYSNITRTTAEKVEENMRFTKLIFPINISKYWDGNAYNNLEEWEYYYDSLHKPKLINNLSFDSTITVIQRDNENVVEYQKVKEIYATDIGLIYKRHIDLDINLSNILDINSGRELEMKVTAYGK